MRRVLGTLACATAIVTLLASATASADTSGGGTQRWGATYQQGAPAYADAVTLSPDGSTVFVTGITEFHPAQRFATLAYDASTGAQRWVAAFPSSASNEYGFAYVMAISPDGSTLFVSGSLSCASGCDASSFSGFATVAYDARTGDQLWVSRFPVGGGGPNAIGVSPDGSRVFVSGTDGDQNSYAIAYDSAAGGRLWKVQHVKASGYDAGALSVSLDGDTVFVTDTAPPDDESCFGAGGYRTSAYNAADGAAVWSSTHKVSNGGVICGKSTDLHLSPDGSIVYVTGYGSRGPNDHRGLYQSGTVAYDAQTGAELWATNDDDIFVLGGDTVVSLGVSPDGSRVFVFGDDCSDYPTCLFATAAYDASTGGRTWISRYDGGGRGYANDLAVSPDGSSLFVTGQETMPCFTGCTLAEVDAPLVAYDTASGNERWATTYGNNLGAALAVSPDGSSVYLAGTFTGSTATARTRVARAATACGTQCGYSTTRFNTGPGPGTFQDPDPSLHFDGWRGFFAKTAVGGAYRASTVAGDTATFRTPKATSVSWLTHQGPNQGKAKLLIDGHDMGIFNLYSPTASRREITFDGLAAKTHSMKVKVLGSKGPSSHGTWVAVDGFRFHAGRGIAEESSSDVRYNAWTGRFQSSASGGSVRKSGSRSAHMSLDFKGRTIKWITATGPAFGRARVVIDGKAQTVDLYRSTRHSGVAITFTRLSKGWHHIVIRPLGRKDARSNSTSVVVDAFVVHN